MLLVPADRVIGQVLANAMHQLGTGPRRLRFLRLRKPGGHRRALLRMRQLAALREPRGHPRHFRACACVFA